MAQRKAIVCAFDQATDTETAPLNVPMWAQSMYVSVPQLTSCTFNVEMSFDEGETYGVVSTDWDGATLPYTAFTGGSTLNKILRFDVKGWALVKVVSTTAQTGKSVQVFFKGING